MGNRSEFRVQRASVFSGAKTASSLAELQLGSPGMVGSLGEWGTAPCRHLLNRGEKRRASPFFKDKNRNEAHL